MLFSEAMKLEMCKKVCSECPFVEGALRGWLGSNSVEQILDAMRHEIPFSCHKMREDDLKANQEKILTGEHKVCRGYIAMSVKTCKMFGKHPTYGKQMRGLQEEIKKEELSEILGARSFAMYHEKI